MNYRRQRYCLSATLPSFSVCIWFAFAVQTVCTLCPDAVYELVPLACTALTSKNLVVESAAYGADGAYVAHEHGSNVLRRDAELDEQTRLVLQLRHRIEVAQLAREAGIDLL